MCIDMTPPDWHTHTGLKSLHNRDIRMAAIAMEKKETKDYKNGRRRTNVHGPSEMQNEVAEDG